MWIEVRITEEHFPLIEEKRKRVNISYKSLLGEMLASRKVVATMEAPIGVELKIKVPETMGTYNIYYVPFDFWMNLFSEYQSVIREEMEENKNG